MGKSGSSFKDTYGVSSTFTGGFKDPNEIKIVGLDIPVEDWNADLWDQARLDYGKAHPIDPQSILATYKNGGTVPEVKVTKRQGMILATEGRRRIVAVRAANALLMQQGGSVNQLIEIPIVVDRGTDLAISVRVGNEGRLDDPPWVKAQNALRLKAMGKPVQVIKDVFQLSEASTLHRWFAWQHVHPEIKRLVSDETLPKDQRVPFNVALDLARYSMKADEPDQDAQILALKYMRATGAVLSGERGRDNARSIMHAVMQGDITEAPGGAYVERTSPDPDPTAPETPEAKRLIETGRQPDTQVPVQHIPGSTSSKLAGESKPSRAPRVQTATQKMSWGSIRQLQAHLEPSANDPHQSDADHAVYLALLVLTGQDPTAEGLAPFPRLQAKFRKVVRSPGDTKADSDPAPPSSQKAPSSQDDDPCDYCDGSGRHPVTKQTCQYCKGGK